MTTPAATSAAPPGRDSAAEGAPAAPATHVPPRPRAPRVSRRALTDDEILGLVSSDARNSDAIEPKGLASKEVSHTKPSSSENVARVSRSEGSSSSDAEAPDSSLDQTAGRELPSETQAVLDANPDLRRAWDDAQAYRETFSTPDAAREATTRLADLDRLDALFFSPRAEDHAELARFVASLDPAAFASLARAMQSTASSVGARHAVPGADAWREAAHQLPRPGSDSFNGQREASAPERARHAVPLQEEPASPAAPTPAQTEFFHAANAAAVEGVLGAIESQVDRLLPEGISKSARNRVVGEIYRELDSTLQSNRQLAQQIREAFRSGALDAAHQRGIVSLVTGRARQALPGVAKRVLGEWTSTIVAASQDRRSRQRAAERRVDVAGTGGGNDGVRSIAPRDLDYARLSDSDILNL